ncbi:RNA polymerase sigma factor [Intrasporangium mesophilum]
MPADTWDRPADTGCTHRSSAGSLEARLASLGHEREDAVRELHALMVRGCRHQVARMRGQLPGLDARDRDDLAVAAADDAVVALLAKLHTFEGRSRFTTWAYKFAILQAATEVRRQAWSRREVPLEDPDTLHWSAAGPAELAVATELAAEVGRALDVALTAYQRRIAVALLVDEVPIDVLAERLGTTRGALYKTLHVARTRVRAYLVASGHLEPRRAGGPGTAGQDEGGGA